MDDFSPVTYRDVNDAWGDIRLPPITAEESKAIVAKLFPRFGGRRMPKPFFMASGYFNRSWAAPKGTNTALSGLQDGLPRAVHDVSHAVFERLHPIAKQHCAPHAAMEKAMIEHVIAKGWHLPKAKPAPKPKPSPAEARAAKLAATRASIKRWESKAKRAATALRKLKARERGLARALQKEATLIAGPVLPMIAP